MVENEKEVMEAAYKEYKHKADWHQDLYFKYNSLAEQYLKWLESH